MSEYAVLGPGGVGGLVAAVLAKTGHDVTCIAREETAETLRSSGISVTSSLFGDFTASVAASTVLDRPVDACFLAVKATALEESLERLPSDAIGDTVLVPLLNGLDHVDLLRRRYGVGRVLPGVIHVESTRVETGVVAHGSAFARISLAADAALAPPRDAAGGTRTDAIAHDLAHGGFDLVTDADAATILWGKLSFLATAALLTTRYRQTMGQVRTGHRDELERVAREIAAVSGADGGPADDEHILAMFDGFNAGGKTSMLRDREAGRPMELDAIGGAVLRAAHAHGIPVPAVQGLVDALAS